MNNTPSNSANKPEKNKEKIAKISDIKVYLLSGFLVVVLFFATKMFLGSIKKARNEGYSSIKSFTFVKKNSRLGLPQKILAVFSFPKVFSGKAADPKKLKSQNLVLNGILLSDGKKFALINNNIVNEGDRIGDAVVLLINADYVELENNTTRFKLTPYKK